MLTPEQARIHTFKVVPSLPEQLKPLLTIAQNLWWTWHPEAVDLFMRIDPQLWHRCNHNPVKLLGSASQQKLDRMARDDAYVAALDRVSERMQLHKDRKGWLETEHPEIQNCCIAYFCAEFGLTECLPVYSGGLGVLAGDHLKSAAELGLPLVGVGLMYRNGYFQQYLNADGWQQEFYPDLDFVSLPVRRLEHDDGTPLTVEIELPGRPLKIAIWEVRIGGVRLFLLDANLPENDAADRRITSQLYGGDMEMRIKQEIVLGIGGVRALEAVDVKPTVWHMNEGHAAFLALERIRDFIQTQDVSFDEARWAGASGNVFTTHTPVPAGIDRFPPEMIQHYFKHYHGTLKLDMEGLLALGRENVFNKNEFFSMAVLALRTSDAANGVSRLHGEIARGMWKSIWPNVPEEEVPIGHVTNGVHARSWVSPDLNRLLDRYLALRWQMSPTDQSVWSDVMSIPDEELWRALAAVLLHPPQLLRRGAPTTEIEKAGEAFDPHALTIGFARRFATYKRANLLLLDPKRLLRILGDVDRPVQIVIAGKAHPADTQGKELIRQLVHFARENGTERRIVFIENYDISVARYLVGGVDVWLNTPRRGMEASGTSGMKAAMNGVLNLSILDGWWDEAYHDAETSDVGWAIGSGETYTNYDYQDSIESQTLYDLLEKQVIPMFYDRDNFNLPRRWIAWMKNSIRIFAPRFNTNRMVQDYAEQFYLPAHRRSRQLMADDLKRGIELAAYRNKVRQAWDKIKVERVDAATAEPLGVGHPLRVEAVVQLATLNPDDVRVQVYHGPADAEGTITEGEPLTMEHVADEGDGKHRFAAEVMVNTSGHHGFAVRVVPGHELLPTPFDPGLIAWDREPAAAKAAAQAAVAAG